MHLILKATAVSGLLAIAMLGASARQKDSVRKAMPLPLPANGLKPYKDIVNARTTTYNGYMKIHRSDSRYYLEIPDSALGREMMIINRVAAAPADFRSADNSYGYAGDLVGQSMFHFEKGEGNKIFIQSKSYKERSTDTSANGLARSLDRNNAQPLVQQFQVKAVSDSLHCSLVDITDYLNQDNGLFSFDPAIKQQAGLGPIAADRSFIESVSANAAQLDFTFTRTYNKPQSKGSTAMVPVTFRINSLVVMLPAIPMQGRLADNRTGYQQTTFIDFDKNPLGVINQGYIYRWRLTPANNGAPVQPVTWYVDSLFPPKWIPAVKAGIEAWNAAFEKAGYKQAIQVVTDKGEPKQLPYAMVSFRPGNGSLQEQLIADPRSGEIIQAQLNFYLSTLQDLYRRYFVQAGALDKNANRPGLDDATMGRLIQAWFTQQTGRLLGLKPNAGASWMNSLPDIRNNAWLKQHAFNSSAMDEALINYAVQPEDKVDPENLLAKVGEADALLINWGYATPAPAATTVAGKVIIPDETPKADNRQIADPRNQWGDVSNDAVKSTALGIRNLKLVAPHLLEWTREPLSTYEKAGVMYNTLVDQHKKYIRLLVNQIGGVYIDARNSDQPGPRFSFVPVATQQAALQLIRKELLETPMWLENRPLYAKTATSFDTVARVQQEILGDLLDLNTLGKLLVARDNAGPGWEPAAYLQQLSNAVFSELDASAAISISRRELQKAYIAKLLAMLPTAERLDNDIPSILKQHAKTLAVKLKQSAAAYTGINKAHLADIYERLYIGLNFPASPDKPTRLTR
ncbi:hypothetical protein J2T02_004163 [Chitinophaga terrae (ex Kim and Jung 2007)]|uniref:zinc-dependent metalloprotease n=1 Tax=Chitinophaga terrae (ex Kim and Jung 2007) TaxID=408074 RepID=UPI00277DDE1B|nr:zinc-dependent metalloprotease [Chitinophaga terrae (ex Kim and Jung 2007)]MDQ0109022.1 hypothetical protein [Chitinophaga terrae (ex Kim and Jung 2007)]